ncbi:Zn2/Cys6 DNA-binding protein [Purpureocillium lavendulum]|uniref:Zn2/Cys6 DNA-binding protein n=1 Tax=Purpureocillium lavendulum TaxID=1247861 RepID=A0AB34FHZ5_9HYPO|nr:Zn2/Cys6 DNA-binding protein [Purpureocillium lavendulum]
MFSSRAHPYDTQLPRRRKRPVISCTECHRRKQKCDRQQPCFHCARRGKTELCLYEYSAEQLAPEESVATEVWPIEDSSLGPAWHSFSDTKPDSERKAGHDLTTSRRLGYSSASRTGTLGMVSRLGVPDHDSATLDAGSRTSDAAQYMGLIRELPSRKHVDILVRSFFANVAWQYDVVDEEIFREQLCDWNQVSYVSLKEGPDSLPLHIRYLPALLFQVLALALLFQPTQYDVAIDDLKYAPDMELADLAADYSLAGHRILSLLGSQDTTLIKVQAGLMKACLEKTMGSVIESWHTLGSTIRDAQELGMHRMGPSDEKASSAQDVAKVREHESRRKLWLVLHLWDAHMAVVLGRPMATRLDPSVVRFSTPLTRPSKGSLPDQHFLPFEIILCGYHTAYKYLQNIHDLEFASKDAHKTIQEIHDAVVCNISRLPAWATSPNPELDCKYPWLPAARETLITEVYFVLLALHRPFILSSPRSRVEALKAALQMLESQNRLFTQAGPLMHMSFTLVFSTFDAMVLVAATYIHFPNDHPEFLPASMKCMEWGLARLDAMRARNSMAGLAFDVVQVLHLQLLKLIRSAPEFSGSNLGQVGNLNSGAKMPAQDFPAQLAQRGADGEISVPEDPESTPVKQPLLDMVCQDLFRQAAALGPIDTGESGQNQLSEPSYVRLWQLMDDLT